MAEHVTYLELEDYPINEEQAAAVYRVLQEYAEEGWTEQGWIFVQRLERFDRQFSEGVDIREIARAEVMEAYREQEKHGAALYPVHVGLANSQLDIFAAVGVEPPREREEGQIGHGATIYSESQDEDPGSDVRTLRQEIEARERRSQKMAKRRKAGVPWDDKPE